MSVSPLQQSPVMGTHQPPSKRDKKRTLLAEKLAEITAQFSTNRDHHYRVQLQTLQVDMNLIMEADAHGKSLLKTDPAEIELLVRESIRKNMMKFGPEPPPGAGKFFSDFAKAVNDAMEERDTGLATHMRDFETKRNTLHSDHTFRKKLAYNEHKALASTLRDRLINSVTNRKSRLAKDKETIEIADSNAYLLHPSQFGVANPSSPGGIHTKRATRNRRDADEQPNINDGNKRKRKAQESDESPAPTRQRVDNGSSTPNFPVSHQQLQNDTPLYSIEKLFTEKEITMTYNTAALAAHSYMLRHGPISDDVESPPNGKSEASSEHERAIAATAEADGQEPGSPAGGVGMERQYSHATRSTRGNFVSGFGIDAFDDINYPANYQVLMRQIPRIPPVTKGRNHDPQAVTTGLSIEEANAELEIIKRARMINEERGYGRNLEIDPAARAILEQASGAKGYTYTHWVSSNNKDLVPVSNAREELTGGEPMSRTGSKRSR